MLQYFPSLPYLLCVLATVIYLSKVPTVGRHLARGLVWYPVSTAQNLGGWVTALGAYSGASDNQ